METKLTKADLKNPDMFIAQTSKAAGWGVKHKPLIIGVTSVLLGLGVVWSVWGMYAENIETKAQTELYRAEKILKTAENPDSNQTPPGAPKKPQIPLTEESARPALDQLKKVVENYPSTQSAVFAALDYSRINYGFKKYDDNIALLQKIRNTPSSPVTGALTYNALASNFEAKDNCKEAIAEWNQIEGREEMAFMHGPVFIKKGLCYEKLGQKAEALKMYAKAEALNKSPEIAKTAKKYSRSMK